MSGRGRQSGSFAKSTTVVFAIRVVDLLFSFAMSTLLASRFGASAQLDAFFLARRSTNGVADATGKLVHMALMPHLVARLDSSASLLGLFRNRLAGGVAAIILCIVSIALIWPSSFVTIFAPGFSGERHLLMDQLVRIMAPLVVLTTLIWILNAMRQASGKHGLVEFAAMSQRILLVGVLLFLVPPLGIIEVGEVLVAGAFLALAIMVAGSLPFIHRMRAERASDRVDGRKPEQDGAAVQPRAKASAATAGAAGGFVAAVVFVVFNQATTLMDFMAASTLAAGSVAALEYGSRLASLVPGLVMSSVSTVMFPDLVRVMQSSDQREAALGFAQRQRSVFAIQTVVSISMAFSTDFIVRLLFGYGAFGAEGLSATIATTIGYSAAAMFLTPLLATTSAIFADARGNSRGDMIRIAATGIALRAGALLALIPLLGVAGIAWGAALATALNLAQAMRVAKGRFADYPLAGQFRAFAKTLAAAGFGSLLAFALQQLMPSADTQWLRLLLLGPTIATFALGYAAAELALFRDEECLSRQALALVLRRTGRA
ncbi:MAG: lipid II flippase MurJ [Novosphingobium sp.]|uniref:lipid II flippase MurJ n=1 Tax=Novosphingobium sp. TaxID=1874826 RepID=UPI002733FA0C|nr:lipid II flippase MurJ [Novosphingobium sp.]MDP3549936.1 lipid II flippase MurJ [Novosphingobium sp.]